MICTRREQVKCVRVSVCVRDGACMCMRKNIRVLLFFFEFLKPTTFVFCSDFKISIWRNSAIWDTIILHIRTNTPRWTRRFGGMPQWLHRHGSGFHLCMRQNRLVHLRIMVTQPIRPYKRNGHGLGQYGVPVIIDFIVNYGCGNQSSFGGPF